MNGLFMEIYHNEGLQCGLLSEIPLIVILLGVTGYFSEPLSIKKAFHSFITMSERIPFTVVFLRGKRTIYFNIHRNVFKY